MISQRAKSNRRLLPSLRFVFVFTIMLVTGCDSMDRAEAVNAMNSGLENLQSGQTLDAVRQLKEAAQIDPNYPSPPYYLGQIYHRKLSELDNAEIHYREALSRDEDNPQIAYQLGTVLADQKKYGDSVAYFRKAVEVMPNFAKAWFRLGLSQQAEKDFPMAVESYMKAINSDPDMKMAEDDPGGAHYHALGDVYNQFGFYDKALKVYENGLLNNPDVPRLLVGKGVAQMQLERYDEAAASFNEALSTDPSLTTATFNLAVAKMRQGQTDVAIKGFEEFTNRADPSRDEARIIAAQGFIQQINQARAQNEEN